MVSRSNHLPVRAEGDSRDPRVTLLKGANEASGIHIPQPERAIIAFLARRNQRLPVRAESHGVYAPGVPIEYTDVFSGTNLPELDRLIFARRSYHLPVGAEGDGIDCSAVPRYGSDEASGADVPKPDRIVTTP